MQLLLQVKIFNVWRFIFHVLSMSRLRMGKMLWIVVWMSHIIEVMYWEIVSYVIGPWSVELYNIWAATWQNQQSDCAPSEDSDQRGHLPSLIRVFAVCMKKAWVLSYPLSAQRRLGLDWADAQADLSLRWALSYIVGFVMSQLIYTVKIHKIWTPEKFAVITLKFEQGGFTIEQCVQKMQTEWQTV